MLTDVSWVFKNKMCTRVIIYTPHTSFSLTPSVVRCQHVTHSWALRATCRFRNSRLAESFLFWRCEICAFNTVWPHVRHEVRIFHHVSQRCSEDFCMWRLIWCDHQTRIFLPMLLNPCWKVSIPAVTDYCKFYHVRFVSLSSFVSFATVIDTHTLNNFDHIASCSNH